jgi:hypothetical protein
MRSKDSKSWICTLSASRFNTVYQRSFTGSSRRQTTTSPWRSICSNAVRWSFWLAGLDLCAKRSGKTSNRATPIISKQGKADLRCALYQAAFIASLKSKDFVPYFTNKLAGRAKENGIGTIMRIKLAAKLLIIAWTLMKKKECSDPEYLKLKNRVERKPAA